MDYKARGSMMLPSLVSHMDILFRAYPDITAMRFIAKVWEFVQKYEYFTIAEKKALVMEAVTLFAAGKDGVMGTADDMLSKALTENLRMLLEKNLVEDSLRLFHEMRVGGWNPQLAAQEAVGCWNLWKGCLAKKK